MDDWSGSVVMRSKIKYFLFGCIVTAAMVFIAWMAADRGKGEPSADYLAVEAASRDIHCPDGATLEYTRWGQSGWLVKCQLNHGPFVAAEHGRIVVRNEYVMGKLVAERKP
jgi:hypothetical protein